MIQLLKQQSVRVKNFIGTCLANYVEKGHTQYNVIDFRNQRKYRLVIWGNKFFSENINVILMEWNI